MQSTSLRPRNLSEPPNARRAALGASASTMHAGRGPGLQPRRVVVAYAFGRQRASAPAAPAPPKDLATQASEKFKEVCETASSAVHSTATAVSQTVHNVGQTLKASCSSAYVTVSPQIQAAHAIARARASEAPLAFAAAVALASVVFGALVGAWLARWRLRDVSVQRLVQRQQVRWEAALASSKAEAATFRERALMLEGRLNATKNQLAELRMQAGSAGDGVYHQQQ